jgi:adenine-specific DNA methylase
MMNAQTTLFDLARPALPFPVPAEPGSGHRALEAAEFPFEEISKIAEQESWRKEVNRPIYHIHKWWAQRLGSVFRALALGAFLPESASLIEEFYRPTRIAGAVVFDPFMGSGTTLGEVLKLGGRAIGQDINAVACFAVMNALHLPPRQAVLSEFRAMEHDTAPRLLSLYSTQLPDGRTAEVLYFFWVKFVDCPFCGQPVDLFRSYVIAQHAYPNRNPEVQIICPQCGELHAGKYGNDRSECPRCAHEFDPLAGRALAKEAACGHCSGSFRIMDAVQASGIPPRHRLLAKLVMAADGQKLYLTADGSDLAAYSAAEEQLADRERPFPSVAIRPGYNTDQVLNYCYRHWHEMFNARQLLCLSILADRIRAIHDDHVRELFCCLFSGVLEFNNMFASYKGEGTGAVRHMFSHHILKPERMPIEANVWGTPRSSGSFSTLFRSRILRALEYAENPFEIKPEMNGSQKITGLSESLASLETQERVQLQCGDSSVTNLAPGSVDAVITDPPFFDNVHYSELADFFHVWQRHILGENGYHAAPTTRSEKEVQHGSAPVFAARLGAVWSECRRVLRDDGLLVFTFHHSRAEGWDCLLDSLRSAGFRIVRAHPIRSEMSVAAPKSQAKEPISFDVALVCRKEVPAGCSGDAGSLAVCRTEAAEQVRRLQEAGFHLSRNDVAVIVMSNAVRVLSLEDAPNLTSLKRIQSQLDMMIVELAQTSRAGGREPRRLE